MTWSEWTHNEEYGLEYRFGATQDEVVLGAVGTGKETVFTLPTRYPFYVEVRNAGKRTCALHAYVLYGVGDPVLVCEFFAGEERVGMYPTVGDALEGKTELRPGESFVRALQPGWWVKEAGRKEVALAMSLLVPGRDMVQLRTKPIFIVFKNGAASRPGGAAE